MLITRLVAGVLGLGLAASAMAEAVPNFRFFAVGTGLADPRILDIASDPDGLLWVATGDGLFRYDGLYLQPAGPDQPDAPTASISRIEFDEAGGLWAMSESHLHYREPGTGAWQRTLEQPPQVPGQGVFDFALAPDGSIWLATWGLGMVRMDPATGDPTFYTPATVASSTEPQRFFYSLLFDREGRLWAGSDQGFHRYDPQSDKFEFYLPPLPGGEPDERADLSEVYQLTESAAGQVLLATDTGPLMFDPASERFEHLPGWPDRYWSGISQRFQRKAVSIAEDQAGRIWVGIEGLGLEAFDPGAETWSNIPPSPEDIYGLLGPFVRRIFVASDGLLWFATDSGLNRLDPRSGRFQLWSVAVQERPQSGLQQIHHLYEDRFGVLWAATNSGLQRLDPETQAWTVHPVVDYPGAPSNVNWTHSITEDGAGRFWVTTAGAINRYDRSANTYETWSVRRAFQFLHDNGSGQLFGGVAFGGGLGLFDPDTGHLLDLDGEIIERSTPETTTFQAYSALLDAGEQHWFATSEGLKRWRSESRSLEDIDLGLGEPHGVARALESADGRLWLATAQGLMRFDPATGRVEHAGQSAFPAAPVYEMVMDRQGRLWLATPVGLVLFDPASGSSHEYGIDDGLPGTDLDTQRLVRRADGTIAAATGDTVFTFDPDAFPGLRPAPDIVLSALEVDDADASSSLASEEQGLVLDHTDVLLHVEFAALDFAHPEQNRYRYRLAGLDESWRERVGIDTAVNYTTLPPGHYGFEVQAANSDGVWGEPRTVLPLQVLPPPWRTAWAYAAYAIVLLLAGAMIVLARTRQVRVRARALESEVRNRTREIEAQRRTIEEQATHLEKLLDTKNRLFADISHEFRTPLTLIVSPLEEAKERIGDEALADKLNMAGQSADRLTRLVDQLLDLARLDAGQPVSRAPQPLSAIISSQVRAFQGLCESRGVELVDEPSDNLWVAVGSDALEKILANLLSNSVKFTPRGGHVAVSVRRQDQAACLEVRDTGVGIPEELQEHIFERFNRGLVAGEQVPGAGIGLALVRELAEACGGHVELRSRPREGTVIRVFLPLAAPPEALLEPSLHPGAALRQEIGALGQTELPEKTEEIEPEKPLVLIVEDNADLRRYLPSVLGDQYRFATAADGETGLEIAGDTIPDLVICDAMLPGIDGFDVCRQIKEDTSTSHVPVLILTARADDASRISGYESHADDYLTKPFAGDELRVRVGNLLESRRILRQRYGRQLFGDGALKAELMDPDQAFIDKLEQCLATRHADPELSATMLARCMAMSLRQLQRKLKALVDHTPAEYIRNYRLNAAKARLAAGETVTQACYGAGFTSNSYFSRCFKAQFGTTPSEFAGQARGPAGPDETD